MINSWRDRLNIYGNYIKHELSQKKYQIECNDIVYGSLSSVSFYLMQNIFQAIYGAVGITVSMPFIARSFIGFSSTAVSLYGCNVMTYEIIKISNDNLNNNHHDKSEQISIDKHGLSSELIRRCLLGTALYLLLEHGFYRTVFPSNSSDYGVFVNTFRRRMNIYSVPVFAVDASQSQRTQIQVLGKALGCHQCGSKSGKFIADHMPPTKIARELSTTWWRKLLSIKVRLHCLLFVCDRTFKNSTSFIHDIYIVNLNIILTSCFELFPPVMI